jgi:hypothetical protein
MKPLISKEGVEDLLSDFVQALLSSWGDLSW